MPAYRVRFSPASLYDRHDAKLADAVDVRIERLKVIVAARDLPSIDIPGLRRTTEELVIMLQSASAKLGLQRATLEAKSQ